MPELESGRMGLQTRLIKTGGPLGILSVLLYMAHVVAGGILWSGYSHAHQPISDLTATGAPNRDWLLLITNVYGIAGLAFATLFTASKLRPQSKRILWGGICLMVMYVLSLTYPFFPEDLPGQVVSFEGTMHIWLTALIVPFTILPPFLIGFGVVRQSGWKYFGYFSITVGCLIGIFGSTAGLFYARKYAYFGIVERLNIGTLQLWVSYLSVSMLRQVKTGETRTA